MGYEPLIRFMKQMQGKLGSALYAPLQSHTNPQHAAFIRQLQKELRAKEELMIPLQELVVVVFDLETTGFFPEQGDQILSIGGVKVQGETLLESDTFYSIVRYDQKLEAHIQELTGLSEEEVREAPLLEEVLVQFFKFAGNHILVAHHAAHEKKFMDAATRKVFRTPFQHRIVDTSFLLRIAEPKESWHHLEDWCTHCQIPVKNRHHALGDALLAAQLWSTSVQKIGSLGLHTLQDVYERLAKS